LYGQILEKNRRLQSLIIIQKYVRVFNAKRRLISIYREVVEKNRRFQSLVTIQKYIRVFHAKRKLINLYQERQTLIQQQKGREQEQYQKRREELKRRYEISAIVIQRYIRSLYCQREMIGLIVLKLIELRDYELKKIREMEEQRKILTEGKIQEKRKARLSKTIDALTVDSTIKSPLVSPRPIQLNQISSSYDPYPDPKSAQD